MIDRVFVEGLALDCVIGVYPHEKTFRQRLYLDLEMAYDLSPAGTTDDLTLTLDYHAISQRLMVHAASCQVALLETLAEGMASILLNEFSVPWFRLKLRKPGAVAEAVAVGIVIERGCLSRD